MMVSVVRSLVPEIQMHLTFIKILPLLYISFFLTLALVMQ